MLLKTFESQPFLYRTPWAGSGIYHPELVTPPRIYAEVHAAGSGALIFLNQETLEDGYEVIYLWLTNNVIYFPGFEYVLYRFNATTGEFLNVITAGSTPSSEMFAQARDGTVWQVPLPPNTNPFHAIKCQIDPVLGIIPEATPTYDLTPIGAFSCFSLDSENDLALIGYNGAQLRVHQISTGALLRSVVLPGAPVQIMPEDTDRCYVYCDNGTVCLVNYTLGTLVSVFRIQSGFNGSISSAISWDRKYRRFLYWTDDGYPLTTEGQNTSTVRGYFPSPQPVGLTEPIPLKPPRQYLKTPMYTRLFGDMGEAVGSVAIALSSSDLTVAVVTGFPPITDSDGEAIGEITDVGSGAVTISASASILGPPVSPALLPTWTDPLPAGATGSLYTEVLTGYGGVPPYTFACPGLPSGLTLVGDSITGTPTGAVTNLPLLPTITDSDSPPKTLSKATHITIT